MKCPSCKGSNYHKIATLMFCEDCHDIHPVLWASGYWRGYFDGGKATDECVVHRLLLNQVLQWRNMDGDGITDPLRQDIIDILEFYKKSRSEKKDAG